MDGVGFLCVHRFKPVFLCSHSRRLCSEMRRESRINNSFSVVCFFLLFSSLFFFFRPKHHRLESNRCSRAFSTGCKMLISFRSLQLSSLQWGPAMLNEFRIILKRFYLKIDYHKKKLIIQLWSSVWFQFTRKFDSFFDAFIMRYCFFPLTLHPYACMWFTALDAFDFPEDFFSHRLLLLLLQKLFIKWTRIASKQKREF